MAKSTALFGAWQAGGMFAVSDVLKYWGDVWFVDSVTGTDSAGRGRDPGAPLATIDYAVGLAAAGDTIICAPTHAETIAGATGCVLDKAGIQLLGVGSGDRRPTLTLATAVGATLSVTSANCLIENIRIISDLADIAAGITAAAGADGLVVRRNYLSDGGATKELVIGISLAAACDRVLIEENEFYTVPGGDCASAIKLVGASDRTRIRNNLSLGDYSAANIDGITAAGTLVTIDGNVMQNIDTTAGLCVNLHASTTGAVVRNLLQGAKTNTPPIVAAGVMDHENYTSAAVGESGIIRPAIETYA